MAALGQEVRGPTDAFIKLRTIWPHMLAKAKVYEWSLHMRWIVGNPPRTSFVETTRHAANGGICGTWYQQSAICIDSIYSCLGGRVGCGSSPETRVASDNKSFAQVLIC
jgi:hypothetical protein